MYYNKVQIEFLYRKLINLTVPTEFYIDTDINNVLNSDKKLGFINNLNLSYLKDEFLDMLELFIHYGNYDPIVKNNFVESLYKVLIRDDNKIIFRIKINLNNFDSNIINNLVIIKQYNMLVMLSGVDILDNNFDIMGNGDELNSIINDMENKFTCYGYMPHVLFDMIRGGKNRKILLYSGIFEHSKLR